MTNIQHSLYLSVCCFYHLGSQGRCQICFCHIFRDGSTFPSWPPACYGSVFQSFSFCVVNLHSFNMSEIMTTVASDRLIFFCCYISGTSLSIMTGMDTNLATSLSSTIAILYTTCGQILAVVYTDILQLLLILIGLVSHCYFF